MFIRNFFTPRFCTLLFVCALLSFPVYSQQDNSSTQAQGATTVEGTVAASSQVTFVVKSDDNQFHLFTFDRNTNKPRTVPVGARVRVESNQGEQAGARYATDVTVLEPAQNAGTSRSSPRNAAPLPPSVTNVENQIRHEARRWRLGARAGVGLNPELILFGIHSQMGPVFSRNIFFRPNAEFAWGEITDMVGLNLETVYRFQTRTRSGRWEPYVGLGPSLNFIHQSFQTKAGQGRNIEFGNFDYETGLNVLLGFQNRHNTFFEVRTSLYSEPAPILRLIVGRDF